MRIVELGSVVSAMKYAIKYAMKDDEGRNTITSSIAACPRWTISQTRSCDVRSGVRTRANDVRAVGWSYVVSAERRDGRDTCVHHAVM